jgi:TPR repeat protein
MRTPGIKLLVSLALAATLLSFSGTARAQNDTSRFYGTWQTSFVYNGQTLSLISVHNAAGYTNYVVGPDGSTTPAGSGSFSAANGKYTAGATAPNDSGTYRFTNANTIVCTNSAGQIATWKRDNNPPPSIASVPSTPAAAPSRPAAAAPSAALAPDPSLPPMTNAAIAAFDQKDFKTAWADFMTAAKQGDSEAQAGVGAMLFQNMNPPGTGYYAQAEQWLTLSANQGNVKGMDFLAQFYYRNGVNIAGGINPGINNSAIPPALQAQAEATFVKARTWFQKSAAKGDGYAMGNLAIMLDAGIGGPKDPAGAQKLRAQVAQASDPNFAKKATSDPTGLAMTASWQAGHYADALKTAQAGASKGDASSEAMLGRAYYEGLGVTRNYVTALKWLNLAVAQNQPDAMFFLGMMDEYGRGVPQNLNKALSLFQDAAKLGQHYADMQAQGMLMQGASDAQAAKLHAGPEDAACAAAGGISSPGECTRGGGTIDPFNAVENEPN